MADNDGSASQSKAASPAAEAAAKVPKQNPVFRMMGLPNFRFRLPSRNWMIFLTITGSWTAALLYDRREKKKVQQKWCALVSHIAQEPLPVSSMPRKVTIVLSAPPADGLMAAREHFHEYVKPVLVAAALDWDVIEGRREGDVRAGLAERIRKLRKMRGEETETPLAEDDQEVALDQLRQRTGIRAWEGVAGDVVIGRHTWKEYVRGLHEGWLGPLDPPPSSPSPAEPLQDSSITEPNSSASTTTQKSSTTSNSVDTSPSAADTPSSLPEAAPADTAQPDPSKEEPPKPTKPKQPPPFIYPSAYPSASLSPSCPPELPPSTAIPFPHILGFLNTPIRMYRFLTRRRLADDIGRETAAAVLGLYRPFERFHSTTSATAVDYGDSPASSVPLGGAESSAEAEADEWEQQRLLVQEEAEWHKSVRKRAQAEPGKENVWVDLMVLDPRVARRMRRFVLTSEEEERAERIKMGKEASRTRADAEEKEL